MLVQMVDNSTADSTPKICVTEKIASAPNLYFPKALGNLDPF